MSLSRYAGQSNRVSCFNRACRRLEGFTVSQEPVEREFGFVIEYIGYLNINATPSLSSPGSSGHPGVGAQSVSVPDTERSVISAAIDAINARNRESIAEHRARAAEAQAARAVAQAAEAAAAREAAEALAAEAAAARAEEAAAREAAEALAAEEAAARQAAEVRAAEEEAARQVAEVRAAQASAQAAQALAEVERLKALLEGRT